uniref:Triacylglycerol lipase n=1 Tax=Plectus sambesii TaxID=2011161 RepID=A0A914UMX0_9BILA
MCRLHLTLVFLQTIAFTLTQAYFTPDFNAFLTSNYGASVQQAFERRDLKDAGSFGGRTRPNEKLSKQAVIFIHGLSQNAEGFEEIRKYYLRRGYTSGELYGITWAEGEALDLFETDMKCRYVKLVRNFILAVQKYTGGQVDVIGYSMGSPMARKAILGGKCVDTGKNLGAPLTSLVDTFVGIAGANYGASALCFLKMGRPCGKTIGLDCKSKYLADINSQRSKYEGRYVFSIYSTEDDVVGYKACGKIASAIPHQDKAFKRRGDHYEVLHSSAELQYSLVQKHRAM